MPRIYERSEKPNHTHTKTQWTQILLQNILCQASSMCIVENDDHHTHKEFKLSFLLIQKRKNRVLFVVMDSLDGNSILRYKFNNYSK